MTIQGSVQSVDGRGVVRMEDRFDTGPEDLWAALTDPARLARWLGEIEGDLRLGGEFRARFRGGGWEGTGQVEECEPAQRLVVRMRDGDPHPGQPEETVIEVRCSADGGQTLLVVEERGLPLGLLAAYGAGIQIHVENLATYLAGREVGDDEARWAELLPVYEARAGAVT